MATKTTIITNFIITPKGPSVGVKSFINPPQNGQNEAAGTPSCMDNLGTTFLWHFGQVTLWSLLFVSLLEMITSQAINKLSFLLGVTSKVTESPIFGTLVNDFISWMLK